MNLKLIKKNKFSIFVVFFFIILFILLLQAKKLFFPEAGDANYGDRLNGIVEVSKDTITNVTSKLNEDERVISSSVTVNGRILNVIVTVVDSVSKKDAKSLAESSKDSIDDAVLKDYDIQLFVKKDNPDENDFPMIGYKAKNSESFTWTKDREKVTVEEES